MAAHLLAVLLCCAAAAPGLLGAPSSPAVTCDEDGAAAAASLAVRHINEHHKHGFKFKLEVVQSSNIEHVPGGCHIDINVKLMQTGCHVTNPKPVDQCEVMMLSERGAVATCDSKLNVMGGVATVASHQCTTSPEMTNSEMMMTCPDCPALLPLNDETGVKAVQEAVKKFNRESNHQNYFALLEISLLTRGYIPSIGMQTWPKFALVETSCPKNSKIISEACVPRCPDRAQHAFCSTSYSGSNGQVGDLVCELYAPKNTEPLPPGAQEPACGQSFHQSPEASACTAQLSTREPDIHQICPFPLAVQLPQVPQLQV
ncbi:alpha-2-HS-glycoprotein-like [Phyllopteryx taeniolatus]|uniref:alpha-2-HS-glycoprotein-like n=1 Tax=Phyllopteryx taeniolatus TaxID=161469 RepID=UPI002AD359ED|nr:alpha-2-HS-glycoprotein-like [Phyllopteryx taeniolatus]